jgi:hypothetical protein
MTKAEAKAILENCEELSQWTDELGATWNYQVTNFSFEYKEAFGFVVYPYSSKQPVDPKHAYQYFVHKYTKEVMGSSAPMVEAEFKKLGVAFTT